MSKMLGGSSLHRIQILFPHLLVTHMNVFVRSECDSFYTVCCTCIHYIISTAGPWPMYVICKSVICIATHLGLKYKIDCINLCIWYRNWRKFSLKRKKRKERWQIILQQFFFLFCRRWTLFSCIFYTFSWFCLCHQAQDGRRGTLACSCVYAALASTATWACTSPASSQSTWTPGPQSK